MAGSSPRGRRAFAIAGWLVGPERLVALVLSGIATVGGILAGLPAVVVGLIALATLTLAVVLIHFSLVLWDRYRQKQGTAVDPGPLTRLKLAHKEGVATLTSLGIQDDEEAQRKIACRWGANAWEVVAEHAPSFSREFFGPGTRAFGKADFYLSCGEEIKELRSAEVYVEKKLQIIERAIAKYELPVRS